MFPLTPTLSLRERANLSPAVAQVEELISGGREGNDAPSP